VNVKRIEDERILRTYAAEILLGLEALHKEGIAHQNLKLRNVVIDEKGHCKLTDMGITKLTMNIVS